MTTTNNETFEDVASELADERYSEAWEAMHNGGDTHELNEEEFRRDARAFLMRAVEAWRRETA